MRPFLTIVTRCCHRPQMLAVNIQSVLKQTDQCIEQVFIVDLKKRGLHWANKSFNANKERVNGDWVYILDDDTKLISPTFVSSLRKIAKNADIIMVKSSRPQLAPHILPKPDVWHHPERLRVTSTNCLCYIVRRELWQAKIWDFGRRAAGDWWFLNAVARTKPRYAWLDLVVAETQQLGRARRFESCGADWWKQIVKQFNLEQDAEGGWVLPLYKRKAAKGRAKRAKRKPAAKRRRKKQKPPTKLTPATQSPKYTPPGQRVGDAPPPVAVQKPPAHSHPTRRQQCPR